MGNLIGEMTRDNQPEIALLSLTVRQPKDKRRFPIPFSRLITFLLLHESYDYMMMVAQSMDRASAGQSMDVPAQSTDPYFEQSAIR